MAVVAGMLFGSIWLLPCLGSVRSKFEAMLHPQKKERHLGPMSHIHPEYRPARTSKTVAVAFTYAYVLEPTYKVRVRVHVRRLVLHLLQSTTVSVSPHALIAVRCD